MTYAVDFGLELGPANGSLSLTAQILLMDGTLFDSGITGWAERESGSGSYSGTYSAFADDTSYIVQWFDAAVFKTERVVSPSDARVLDLTALVATLVTALGSGRVTVVSPVAQSGDVEIVRGDDYANADGRALEWTNAAGSWPNLTGATITWTAKQVEPVAGAPSFITKAATAPVSSGPGQTLRLELTAAETALGLGSWNMDLQATLMTSGRKVTLLRGTLVVLSDISA